MDDKPGKFSSQQLKAHFGRYYLHLLLVCKPHNEAVTCMDIDPKGELLASGVSRTTSITCRAVLLTVHLGHTRGNIHQQQMRRGRGKEGGNGGGGGQLLPTSAPLQFSNVCDSGICHLLSETQYVKIILFLVCF